MSLHQGVVGIYICTCVLAHVHVCGFVSSLSYGMDRVRG